MNRVTTVALVLALAPLSLLLPQACSKRLPHGGDSPVYPLLGLHAGVPCEACHGTGTPKKLPNDCMSCHNEDRPGADHHPGVDCANCHVPDGWDVVTTTPPDSGTTPIIDSSTTTPTFQHPEVPPEQLCTDCHEVDRKDAAHYTDPDPLMTWDCGPCHTKGSWVEDSIVHPARTPHGTYRGLTEKPSTDWVVACDTCHVVSTEKSDCSTCHLAIFPHYGDAVKPGDASDLTCLPCHVNGDL